MQVNVAEDYIFAALFHAPERADEVLAALRPEDLPRPARGKILAAVAELRRRGEPFSPFALDHLAPAPEGYGSVSDWLLEVANEHLNPGYLDSAVRAIKDDALRRRAQEVLRQAQSQLMQQAEVESVLVRTTAQLQELAGEGVGEDRLYSALELAAAAEEEARSNQGRPEQLLITGIDPVDRALRSTGRGRLVVLAGRPSTGKSTLALQAASNASERGYHVLFLSLEMSRAEVGVKLLARQARATSDQVYAALADPNLEPGVADRLGVAVSNMVGWTFAFREDAPWTLDSVASTVRRAHLRRRVDLVVLDYLQILERPGVNTTEEIAAITRRLKLLAGEINCCVLALSQLRRPERDFTRPTLPELRGSGAIEQDADAILATWADHPPQGEFYWDMYISILKQRSGARDLDFGVRFNGPYSTFTERERAPVN